MTAQPSPAETQHRAHSSSWDRGGWGARAGSRGGGGSSGTGGARFTQPSPGRPSESAPRPLRAAGRGRAAPGSRPAESTRRHRSPGQRSAALHPPQRGGPAAAPLLRRPRSPRPPRRLGRRLAAPARGRRWQREFLTPGPVRPGEGGPCGPANRRTRRARAPRPDRPATGCSGWRERPARGARSRAHRSSPGRGEAPAAGRVTATATATARPRPGPARAAPRAARTAAATPHCPASALHPSPPLIGHPREARDLPSPVPAFPQPPVAGAARCHWLRRLAPPPGGGAPASPPPGPAPAAAGPLRVGGGWGRWARGALPLASSRRLSRRDWPGAARGGVAAAAARGGALKGPRRGGALSPRAMAYQGLAQEYLGMPAVTRAYTTACVLTTAAVQLEFITPFQLYFNPDLIFRKFQIWRLITNFLFFGPLGFSFFFNMIFLYRYCRMLEEGSFRGRTADFVFMFLFGGFLMTLFGLFASLFFLGQAFTIMLVYVWSRRNPYIRMNFFGLLNFQAPFLPWVLMGFSLLLGNSIIIDLLGIAVGHIYYFLEDVFPNQPGGKKLLLTPGFLKMVFDTPEEDPNYNPLPEDRPENQPRDQDQNQWQHPQ